MQAESPWAGGSTTRRGATVRDGAGRKQNEGPCQPTPRHRIPVPPSSQLLTMPLESTSEIHVPEQFVLKSHTCHSHHSNE